MVGPASATGATLHGMSAKPQVVIIGGVNGAGKTTIYPAIASFKRLAPLHPKSIPRERFVNMDELAAEKNLSPMAAGRAVVKRRDELIARRESFAYETTVSDEAQIGRMITTLRASGYRVYFIYLTLENWELSAVRVTQRALTGGHYIPFEALERRHDLSHAHFIQTCAPRSFFWLAADNSGLKPELIAWGWGEQAYVAHPELFERRFPEADQLHRCEPAEDKLTRAILRNIQQQVHRRLESLPKVVARTYWDGKVRFTTPE